MAYEYDRLEREDGGGSFLMGLLAGTVLGAGLGMLFAPKTGSDLRNQISEQTGRLKSTANDAYSQVKSTANDAYSQASEKVSQIVDRGREAYDRARHPGSDTTSGTGTTSGVSYGTGTTGFGSENRG